MTAPPGRSSEKEKKGGETMQSLFSEVEDNEDLNWNTPQLPYKYASVVVVKNTVVLVRHHYAETGDVEEIFNEYIDEKAGEK